MFLILDYNFYHTITKILSDPVFLSEVAKNTTLATSLIYISIIYN